MPTWVRASAEMMPCVTVWPTPNGLPIASTTSPTRSSSELAKSSVGNFSRPSFRRSTARSVRLSLSTISDSRTDLAVLRLKDRSEEHTSELQSRGHLVCRLLLEKKKDTYLQLH